MSHRIAPVFLAVLTSSLALVGAAMPSAIDLSPVWSGHPVGFELRTQGDKQIAAFYDAERRMTIAIRDLNAPQWHMVRLPTELGWDSHNYVTFAIDRAGYIHVSGNMHTVPLIYFRSAKPMDIDTFERIPQMIGRNEQSCTYPSFIRGISNELVFTYRDGGSGNGDQYFNVYDENTRSWRRLLDHQLTDGQGRMNAYFQGPVSGPDGFYHLVWVWRDSPDCSTDHDLCYARSRDLVHWETSSGKPFSLPIRVESAEIVDPVKPHGGIINGGTEIGFDSRERPVITYQKFDTNGFNQIYAARLEEGLWKQYQISRWNYRWDFQGRGSIEAEITAGSVKRGEKGFLLLDFRNKKLGSGTWILDEHKLQPVGEKRRSSKLPAKLQKPESDFPGMRVHWLMGSGESPTGSHYALRWETLGSNRDHPRAGTLPQPSMLRLYEIK
jgi:hypothetical protein